MELLQYKTKFLPKWLNGQKFQRRKKRSKADKKKRLIKNLHQIGKSYLLLWITKSKEITPVSLARWKHNKLSRLCKYQIKFYCKKTKLCLKPKKLMDKICNTSCSHQWAIEWSMCANVYKKPRIIFTVGSKRDKFLWIEHLAKAS